MGMMKAIWPVCLQVVLAPVGVGGVFAVTSGAGWGQEVVVWRPIQEDRVRLAAGRGAASQCWVLGSPHAVGGAAS